MSKIKGLIFDLDGVLVSTERNHYLAWKRTAKEIGIYFNEIDNENLRGLSRKDSLSELLKIGNKSILPSAFNELLHLKNQYYLNSISNINNKDLLPGVNDFLKRTNNMGLSLAVGSSSKNAHFILEKTKIKHYFASIIDGNMVRKPKPDPEVFINASYGLNLTPANCLVFEDAKSGVQSAKSGLFKVVGVGNKNIQNECDYFVDNINEFDIEKYAESI